MHDPMCETLPKKKLNKTTYPCLGENTLSPLVLLPGWSFDSRIWQDLIKSLQQFTRVITLDLPGFGDNHWAFWNEAEAVCENIVRTMPPRAVYAGWSLGGMLATKIAANFPERVAGIITLATNVSFVESQSWPHGMSIDKFKTFYNAVEKDLEEALKRFHLMIAQGDQLHRQQFRWLQAVATQTSGYNNLLAMLSLLAKISNCDDIHRLQAPGLHIFGEQDHLVPLSAVQQLMESGAQGNNRQQYQRLENTGHLVFWPSDRVVPSIKKFLTELC